jgi:hypothetical protein
MLALLSSRFICLGFKSPSIKLIANVFTLILITAVISVLTAFGLDTPQIFIYLYLNMTMPITYLTLRINSGASWTVFSAVCFAKNRLFAESDLMRLLLGII